MTDAIQDLSYQARTQSLPGELLSELQGLLTGSTHRVARARAVASKYLDRLITSFPSLMCDPPLVFSILEVLTLLRRSCEGEYVDEVCLVFMRTILTEALIPQYNPVYEFHSDRVDITLQLPDDYKIRDEILVNLLRNSSRWFELALSRAPMELRSTLQVCIPLLCATSRPITFLRNTLPSINRSRPLTQLILVPLSPRIMERSSVPWNGRCVRTNEFPCLNPLTVE